MIWQINCRSNFQRNCRINLKKNMSSKVIKENFKKKNQESQNIQRIFIGTVGIHESIHIHCSKDFSKNSEEFLNEYQKNLVVLS